MRIQQIQTFRFNQYNSRRVNAPSAKTAAEQGHVVKNSLADYTYNRLLVNKNKINFTGAVDKAITTLGKQVPLEDRLADAFSYMKHGDLIITSNSLKTAQNSLLESLKSFNKNVIKRAFFIEDEDIKGTLAFTKDTLGDTEIINTNNKSVFIVTGGREYELPKNGSYYVISGDAVKIEGNIINIKDKPKADISKYRTAFAKPFNFEKDAEDIILRQNKKVLSNMYSEKKSGKKTMFADVIGQDEVIKELKENILYPLRNPRAFENFDLHHGFILKGGPGLGKTHTATALINEAGMNYRFLNGLELENKYVGESEAAWRALFDEAKANQPYLLFIDEFDSVGRARGGHDEYGDKVVNQILSCMTDIDDNKLDVFVMAATNFFDKLDSALIRSGRFGKILDFKTPDLDATRKLLDCYIKGKPVSEKLSKDEIAKQMFAIKCTGADVKRLVTDAYMKGYERTGITAKLEANTLTDADLDEFKITDEDFTTAINNFLQGKKKDRKPIGFTK